MIYFKQISVHDINLNEVNLDGIDLKFYISFRSFKQKSNISLGCAKFNFSLFETNKNLTCTKDLNICLNESTPLVMGTLKVSIQMGCGRLYFGKEFMGMYK